jgi:2'-5' RNA ligase
MRLFLSCEVPKDIADYIHVLAARLPQDAKYTLPKNIDLTVKFLGDTPDTKLEEIKRKLSGMKFKPFRAMLNGIGVFTEDFIRVVWVGLTPSEKFEGLHVLADDALAGLFPKEKRFQAHLTIARVKYVENKEQFLEAVKKITVEPKTFDVGKLVLVKSQLSPKGAIHEPVLEIKAQASPT